MSADLSQLPPQTPQNALLRLLWLASPALPIGAYAYSRGLEFAVDAGWLTDADTVARWVEGVMERQIGMLDAPAMVRMFDAYTAGDTAAVARWNEFLRAARETAELALEDRQLGLSLGKVLREAGVPDVPLGDGTATYAQLFARACVHYGISRADAVLGFLFAFAEGQVTAASKVVPLGQSAAQRVLAQLFRVIDPIAQTALSLSDEELGATTPGLTLASMLHETQYTRLFRS